MTGPQHTGARPEIEIMDVGWDHPDGVALRAAQRAELDGRYGRDDHEPGTVPTAQDIAAFVLARTGGASAGCGALRRLDDTTAEIKRMYVAPSARGTGVAVAILRGLEQRARAAGWTTLRLETGDRQPDAMRFYEREGYHPIPRFGAYTESELSRCYERQLD